MQIPFTDIETTFINLLFSFSFMNKCETNIEKVLIIFKNEKISRIIIVIKIALNVLAPMIKDNQFIL